VCWNSLVAGSVVGWEVNEDYRQPRPGTDGHGATEVLRLQRLSRFDITSHRDRSGSWIGLGLQRARLLRYGVQERRPVRPERARALALEVSGEDVDVDSGAGLPRWSASPHPAEQTAQRPALILR
jgi:hypothetical protein